MNTRRLALAAAEFTSAAAIFAHAVLLSNTEHRTMKIAEAVASVRKYLDRVEEVLKEEEKSK